MDCIWDRILWYDLGIFGCHFTQKRAEKNALVFDAQHHCQLDPLYQGFPKDQLTVCYTIENGHRNSGFTMIYPLNMVIFHSYVSLPEGT